MSLKRRPKIQHSTSPKSLIHRQIDQDSRLYTPIYANKENSTEQYLLNKMQQKINKILQAYQKLQNQSQAKDQLILKLQHESSSKHQLIQQLQKQNLLLKQRLVDITTQKHKPEPKTHPRKQPNQELVLQRTFTPFDLKKQTHLPSQKINFKTTHFTSPFPTILKQHDSRVPLNCMLKQSRSLENLNMTTVTQSRESQYNNLFTMPNDYKIFSKRDENRSYQDGFEEDKSFIDVLGKLKEKIRKFDEQQSAQNSKKTIEKEQIIGVQNKPDRLQKVKSSENITRRQFSFMDKPQQVQTKTLKRIWNQRDEQIKKMDELFSKIDQRINVIEKQ